MASFGETQETLALLKILALAIEDYRQTPVKARRVICRVPGRQIVIYRIVDGRRDMQSVLARRLLGA